MYKQRYPRKLKYNKNSKFKEIIYNQYKPSKEERRNTIMRKGWLIVKAILKAIAGLFGTKVQAIEESTEEIIDIVTNKKEKE